MPSIHGSLTYGIISFPQSWNSHQCNVSVLDAKQALQIVLGTTAQGDIVYCFLSCTCLIWLRLTLSDYSVHLLPCLCPGAEYGAVTALGINTNSTRLLCGHAKGQVTPS